MREKERGTEYVAEQRWTKWYRGRLWLLLELVVVQQNVARVLRVGLPTGPGQVASFGRLYHVYLRDNVCLITARLSHLTYWPEPAQRKVFNEQGT